MSKPRYSIRIDLGQHNARAGKRDKIRHQTNICSAPKILLHCKWNICASSPSQPIKVPLWLKMSDWYMISVVFLLDQYQFQWGFEWKFVMTWRHKGIRKYETHILHILLSNSLQVQDPHTVKFNLSGIFSKGHSAPKKKGNVVTIIFYDYWYIFSSELRKDWFLAWISNLGESFRRIFRGGWKKSLKEKRWDELSSKCLNSRVRNDLLVPVSFCESVQVHVWICHRQLRLEVRYTFAWDLEWSQNLVSQHRLQNSVSTFF